MSITVVEGVAIVKALTDAVNMAQITGNKEITTERLEASFTKAGASLDKLRELIEVKRKAAEGADDSKA